MNGHFSLIVISLLLAPAATAPTTAAKPDRATANRVLKEFVAAADRTDYVRAGKLLCEGGSTEAKTIADDSNKMGWLRRMVDGAGRWSRLDKLISKEWADLIARSIKAEIEDCYAVQLDDEKRFTVLWWSGTDFRILRIGIDNR